MDNFEFNLRANLDAEKSGCPNARNNRIDIINNYFNHLGGANDQQSQEVALTIIDEVVRRVLREHHEEYKTRPDIPWPIIGYN